MTNLIKVGVMPGRIQEVAVEIGTPISTVLTLAGLDAAGYEIKVDGVVSSVDTLTTESTNLVLLTKQVKGNGLVKVGVMPGRIQEVAVDSTSTIFDALQLADLSANGYEIKVDGVTKTADEQVGTAQLILLTKQVKGNK
jgi:G3E family GTPase